MNSKKSEDYLYSDKDGLDILSIGVDDTDSRKGMCTTYLAYKIASFIENSTEKDIGISRLVDYPSLVRFNPNIPWKTRGNGAVCLRVETDSAEKLKEKVGELLQRYSSDQKEDANPGVAFHKGKTIPVGVSRFSEYCLHSLVKRAYAKEFAKRHGIDMLCLWGNCQGIVGAIGAIGYTFENKDHTFELISYRNKKNFGKSRIVDHHSVEKMQQETYPYTFNSYDVTKKRILILPHGPDPVFFGIRGETVESVIKASQMVRYSEKLEGHMVFRSNQGTGAHLSQKLDCKAMPPYSSGTITGTVIEQPKIVSGGHVFFKIKTIDDNAITTKHHTHITELCKSTVNAATVPCAVYYPTAMTKVAANLVPGDVIQTGGGIRRSSSKHPRTLNVEFINIKRLNSCTKQKNPFCYSCDKSMKSKGRGQGFSCLVCGKKAKRHINQKLTRSLEPILYIPIASAHRHLTRPIQRMGVFNRYNPNDFFKKEEQKGKVGNDDTRPSWLLVNRYT